MLTSLKNFELYIKGTLHDFLILWEGFFVGILALNLDSEFVWFQSCSNCTHFLVFIFSLRPIYVHFAKVVEVHTDFYFLCRIYGQSMFILPCSVTQFSPAAVLANYVSLFANPSSYHFLFPREYTLNTSNSTRQEVRPQPGDLIIECS